MDTKEIFRIVLFTLWIILLEGCLNGTKSEFGPENVCQVEENNGNYVIKSEAMGIHGLQVIDLSQVWDKTDKFGFHDLTGSYRGEGDVYLDIKNNGNKLIAAEEQITYVPSIWSIVGDPVIQYIELSDLAFIKHIPLQIIDGIVVYPQPLKEKDPELDAYFLRITKEQLIAAIENYYKSAECIFIESRELEKKYYLKYAKKYKEGDYKSGEIGKMFDILDITHEILLTYMGDGKKYTKSIVYTVIHGN